MEENNGHQGGHSPLQQYDELGHGKPAMHPEAAEVDAMDEMGHLQLSHTTEVEELRKQVAALQQDMLSMRHEMAQLRASVMQAQRASSNAVGDDRRPVNLMDGLSLSQGVGQMPEMSSTPQPSGIPEPIMHGGSALTMPHGVVNHSDVAQYNAEGQFMQNSSQFDGLITLGHAAEHAASGSMQKPAVPVTTQPKKRQHSESLQLDLDEDQVLAELKARRVINENPADDPKVFRGGRPPLGMGPYKRVKELYDKRMITMEDWRVYYADKCRECGYEGAFRKDLRPRLNHPKPRKTKHTSMSSTYSEVPPTVLSRMKFPPDSPDQQYEAEVRIVKTLCKELQYAPNTAEHLKFIWDRDLSDDDNMEALRKYLVMHRPLKMRRGKKPDGIGNFPVVFDLWSLSLIESSQFKRISKYAGIQFAAPLQPQQQPPPPTAVMDAPPSVGMLPQPQDAHVHDHGQDVPDMVPPPDHHLADMSRMLERGLDPEDSGEMPMSAGPELVPHGVPHPPEDLAHGVPHPSDMDPVGHAAVMQPPDSVPGPGSPQLTRVQEETALQGM